VAYVEFPDTKEGMEERRAFWSSPDGAALVAGWRREGLPLDEIAVKYVGVSATTFRKWRYSSQDLDRAIRQTDELVDAMVEESLLKRALGYDAVEVDEELVEGEMRVVSRRTRHVPADTKACLSWLYSRRPDRWRAQQDPRDATAEQLRQVKDVLVSIASAAELPAAEGEEKAPSDG